MSVPKQQEEEQPAAAPSLPDYLANPNAVLEDTDVQWRYGRAPDYSKTRAVWADSKKANHVAGSLPELVENLVKNWEVEASFKTRLSDWRTVDHENYTFAINGGPPQTGEHMLRVGTYNAIIAPNEYYSPENSDFASSHKTFKRMMPTFAWEVIEVYSGPPRVSFKWRHWGTMKNDYVGFNDKGEKVTAKAHGGIIDILGITIATVDEKVRLQAVDTYFDPLDMFRQIAPKGVVNKQVVNKKVFDADRAAALDVPSHDGVEIAQEHNNVSKPGVDEEPILQSGGDVFHDALSDTSEEAGPDYAHPEIVTKEDNGVTSAGTGDTGEKVTLNPKLADTNADATNKDAEPSEKGTKSGAEEATCPVGSNITDTESIQAAVCPVTGRSRVASQSSGSGWEHLSTLSSNGDADPSPYSSSVTGSMEDRPKIDYSAEAGQHDEVDRHLEKPASEVHPHPSTMEKAVHPEAGEAVAAEADTEETIMTHEEMSRITAAECPFLMNRE